MRAETLLILFATSVGSAFAVCHHHAHSALNAAIDQVASVQLSAGQQPVHERPHRPHPPHKKHEANGTIFETLENDPRFSKLTKALKWVDEVGSFLNDSSANVTFFAVPDFALKGRHRKHGKATKLDWSAIDALDVTDLSASFIGHGDLSHILELVDDFNADSSEDNPNKEKRKKILKFIVRAILAYHIIPTEPYPVGKLGLNATFPTNLKFPHVFDGQPLRLKIDHKFLPPVTTVNFFSRILFPDVPATNGIIHVVNHPLLPPPSVFQELYLVPQHFSIFTSTLQRSALTGALDLKWSKESGLNGSSLVTVFAPSNRAFESLPPKLRFFLFSPFGARVLTKLLQYHIVPDVAIFSDYIHSKQVHEETPDFDIDDVTPAVDSTVGVSAVKSILPWFLRFNFLTARSTDKPRGRRRHAKPISHVNVTLETSFTNHTIEAVFDKSLVSVPIPRHKSLYKVENHVFANHQFVPLPNLIGLNGAIHVVHKFLDPRKHAGPPESMQADVDWEDWEDWLPQWGEQ